MRTLFPVALVLLAGALASQRPAVARTSVPIAPLASVQVGQRAEVRTVLRGDSIASFEAEILGVLPGGRAGGDLILARIVTPEVAHLGVAQGMSGSPVTINGRLIGALSSGWGFSRDPVFGITPIEEMLRVLDEPESPGVEGTAGPIGVDPQGGPAPRFRGYHWEDGDPVEGPAIAAQPSPSRPASLLLPLTARGLSPALVEPSRVWLSGRGLDLRAGASGTRQPVSGGSRPTVEPGSSVSVDVLRGDLELSAIGTVTYVDGDRVLLFGHPFFQSGEIRLPLSTAPITMVMPSYNTSFKLGVPGVPIGTATQDRRAAVAARLGASPSLLPFRVEIRRDGLAPKHFTFASVEDPALLPQLVSTATVNSLLESGGTAAQQSVRWHMQAWRAGRALEIRDVAAGDAPLADMMSAFLSPLRFLYTNPYERLRLDSLSVRVDIVAGRGQSFLRAASARRPSVRPGESLEVDIEIERWRGGRETQRLTIAIPHQLPAGRHVLWLGGGIEADRHAATRLPGRFRPVSLSDAWRRLGAVRPSDALYAVLWRRAPEVTQAGEDYPGLPASAMALLAPAQSAGDRVRTAEWIMQEELRRPMDGVLRGELVLEVTVDPEAPR